MSAAPSQTPEAAGLEDAGHIVWWKAGGVSYYPKGEDFTVSASCRVEPLVTAASAQARIAELEGERDQIAGESIWWKAVIGDGEYTPSGEVPSIKHLHPAMVKPIYEAHKGTAVADVIAGLIFSRAITENREQFLVGYHTDRATAAEARADRLADSNEGLTEDLYQAVLVAYRRGAHEWAWLNYPQWRDALAAGQEVAAIARAALQQETQP